MANSDDDVLKILLATDCHLGYMESDAVRGEQIAFSSNILKLLDLDIIYEIPYLLLIVSKVILIIKKIDVAWYFNLQSFGVSVYYIKKFLVKISINFLKLKTCTY